jgi:hypothetical protein
MKKSCRFTGQFDHPGGAIGVFYCLYKAASPLLERQAPQPLWLLAVIPLGIITSLASEGICVAICKLRNKLS